MSIMHGFRQANGSSHEIQTSDRARLDGCVQGHKYRICPVNGCPATVAEMSLHLRNVHSMAKHQVKIESRNAGACH